MVEFGMNGIGDNYVAFLENEAFPQNQTVP